jgi:two-component system KDP operon response regulator KdpE
MSEPAQRIVLIEDDVAMRELLRTSLQGRGYAVSVAETAALGLTIVEQLQPALVVLDLGLPDMDGLEVIRRLRQWSAVPIIILSARYAEAQKVEALDLGANDYVTKPFGMDEVVARIRVALRHAGQPATQGSIVRSGLLELNLAAHAVTLGGRELHLTPTEYRLLRVFMLNLGRVLTHALLLREVWGPSYQGDTQLLRGFIAQLRQKIEPQPGQSFYLITEPGVGYRMLEHPF